LHAGYYPRLKRTRERWAIPPCGWRRTRLWSKRNSSIAPPATPKSRPSITNDTPSLVRKAAPSKSESVGVLLAPDYTRPLFSGQRRCRVRLVPATPTHRSLMPNPISQALAHTSRLRADRCSAGRACMPLHVGRHESVRSCLSRIIVVKIMNLRNFLYEYKFESCRPLNQSDCLLIR
jgi:hypothetical protein